jgi:hypothetical protein
MASMRPWLAIVLLSAWPLAARAQDAGRSASPTDPDGNDDPVTDEPGPPPTSLRFVRVGRPPLSLKRICDLRVYDGALYAAHANEPLGTDGATITRYQPDSPKPFSVAFDWNRPGEPTKGGGAGQGFLRVHRIGGRLFVPDADPPYNGFGISEWGTEGFVFVSDANGKFASTRAPHHRPPGVPSENGAGAGVLPRAYHVIDVIRFRGRLYASTGSVPPKERAWTGPSPGALHVASPDLSRWTFEVDYPYPWKDGVWRLTFLVRFRDRLYAGIQDYDGREPNDYVVLTPPAQSTRIERSDVHAVRVTPKGGAQTIRWLADRGKLYWIAWTKEGPRLLVTEDGDTWKTIALPQGVGFPTDIVRYKSALHVLTEWALVRLSEPDYAPVTVALVDEKKTPFAFQDTFCAAPLASFRGELYAGSQRNGTLYRLTDSASAETPTP